MRIGIARLWTEASTFSPALVDMDMLRDHGILRGPAALTDFTLQSSIPGFLDVVGDQEPVGILATWVKPAGYLTDEGMHALLSWFTEDLQRALPLDGLLLNLHGAFAAASESDFEGLILHRAREILGDRAVIGAAMDMHAQITRRKTESADVIYGYHTHPHTDFRETGRRTARMLMAALRGEARPTMRACKIPMIPFLERNLTDVYPFKALMDEIYRQEADPKVLGVSIFAVQTYLDIPEMGWASAIVTDGDPQLAERLARRLAQMAWDQREAYAERKPNHREALDEAFASSLRPVVVADFADLTGGGGTGDSTWYLKELMARKPSEPCYLTMVDRQAVAQMAAAGAGATVTVSLGGKLDKVYSTPVKVTGEVLRFFRVSPQRELPTFMGLTAVLRTGNIYIVVSERQAHGHRSTVYTQAGLDPVQAKILVAKSVVDFREGFADVGKLFLVGEAPGLAPSNLRLLKWETINRPIFPLDDGVVWDSASATVYAGHGG